MSPETKRVMEAIKRRHPDDGEWIVFEEFDFIDAWVLRCYAGGYQPSGLSARPNAWWPRRYHRIAYEIKVSRADFRREIANPLKRARALSLSHEFYFICPSGLIQPEEVPPDAGLVWVKDDGTSRIKVRAPVADKVEPLRMSQVVSLMRRRHTRGELSRAVREAKNYKVRSEQAEKRARERHEEMLEAEAALARVGRHLLVVGSQWRGAWGGYIWEAEEADVLVEITEVRVADSSMPWVHFERLDGIERPPFSRRSEIASRFLTRYSPASTDN